MAWISEKLAKKHPSFSLKAINELARSFIQLNEDVVWKQRESKAQSPTEPHDPKKNAHDERINHLTNAPGYQNLFTDDDENLPPHSVHVVDVPDQFGRTALHHAAYTGNITLVKQLVEHDKADHSVKDHAQNTPYQIAVREGHLQISSYLAKL
jgi:ankyrin repeat protein